MAYTTIDNPELYFQTKIYSANNTDSTAITLDGDEDMSPNMCWWKNRSDAYSHRIIDTVRGVTKILPVDTDAAEATNSNALASFDSDGFTLNADGDGYGLNYANAHNIVAWCWKGGTTSGITTNAATDITPSAYSFNTTAKFSIAQYAGATTAGQLAHGLGVTPTFHMIKKTSGTGNWQVYSKAVGNTATLSLNQNYATDANAYYYNNTDPDSVNITLGSGSSNTSVNTSGQTYMCYSFADVQGYSKFGSYTGNGNADGPFCFTGFRPAFLMCKRTDSTDNWVIVDNKRDPFNLVDERVFADLSQAEGSQDVCDFTANGFKVRTTSTWINASGGTYVYMAFAEAPFVNSNGVPCTAR